MKPGREIIFYSVTLLVVCFLGCKKETVFKTYAKPEITINANDTRLTDRIIHFFKDTVYVLAANLSRHNGEVLIIDAGVLVKVNDGLSVTINPGARIEARGTTAEPIVFTSSAYKGSQGFVSYTTTTEHSWLGMAIYGNYPGGIDSTPAGTGILHYMRIEFAGRSYNQSNFQTLPPLLLQNIGKGTSIENIQVSYSVASNSIEISGGNFNAHNLVSYASGGTDFYLKDGYTGMLQNLLAYRHPFFSPQLSSGTTLAGLLIDGPSTFPAISNITVLGPDLQIGTNPKYLDTISAGPFGTVNGSRVASLVIRGGQFHIRNSIFLGFPKGGFYLDERNSAISLQQNVSDFTYSIVHCNDSARAFYLSPDVYPPYTSRDLKDFMMQPGFNNQLFFSSSPFILTDPYNYDFNPNPLPQAGSPLLTGANFETTVFSDPFFGKVSYRGALGSENWLQGWTNFIPLQTNYNN
jgi:hypothetical protein